MGLFTSKTKDKQLEFAVATMNQLHTSRDIVNETRDPAEFFYHLNLILDLLLGLRKIEKYKLFTRGTPTQDYNRILSNLEKTVDDFIDRALKANHHELSQIRNEDARRESYNKFLSSLENAFNHPHSFWCGSKAYPHYRGHLFTNNNYRRIQCIVRKPFWDVIDSKLVCHLVDYFKKNLSPCSEPHREKSTESRSRDSYARYGGVDAELLTVDLMEGHDFEYWCSDVLRDIGFTDVEVTPGSGDHGVDVLASKEGLKYAIQCKRYSSDLGNSPVQEVHAGKYMYHCHIGPVITNQHFTSGAKQLAEATGVLLWDRDWIKRYLNAKASPDGSLSFSHTSPSDKITQPDSDELLLDAIDVVVSTKQASVSIVQRTLDIGYARAARIIDEMERIGVIGPFQGSQPRTILITLAEWQAVRDGLRLS